MNHLPSIPFSGPISSSLMAQTNESNSFNLKEDNLAAIQNAGQEFESIFYGLLLKEMRNSIDSTGEGGLFPGEKSDTLGSLFDLYMGQHLSSANSLGISQAIISYLSNQPEKSFEISAENSAPSDTL